MGEFAGFLIVQHPIDEVVFEGFSDDVSGLGVDDDGNGFLQGVWDFWGEA